MKIISPFYIIFNKNNWFYNSETCVITYSDDIVSLNNVYLEIPMKDDDDYNKKLLIMLKNFITNLYTNLLKNNKEHKLSTNVFKLLENKKKPHIVNFKSVYVRDTSIYFDFSDIN